ncbi:hypothetical protein AUC68_04745 [Methyloceanibacter methanicus]|uniref:Uncharacterized protein n=1 Tax=Methyloceanibacter methanicus TaxID=1774968 RepID=A0A1E3W2E5_9HYPH|nr:hypothetical protein [Methyloceanibacter methanicus]ODR99306.1 hypothetical protein AUC68_04745 [Methyloceanibacter methanicus]
MRNPALNCYSLDDDVLDAEQREVMELIGERCDFGHWIDDYLIDLDLNHEAPADTIRTVRPVRDGELPF